MSEEYNKQLCGDCQCRPQRPDCPPPCPPPCDPCYSGNNNGTWGWILVLIVLYCLFCNGNDNRGGLFGGLF